MPDGKKDKKRLKKECNPFTGCKRLLTPSKKRSWQDGRGSSKRTDRDEVKGVDTPSFPRQDMRAPR